MSRVCEQDEEAVDMEDFIDSGGLEEDTNTLELPDQKHSKVRLEHLSPKEQCCGAGTGTAETVTFCLSGTGTGMHYGSIS